LGALPSNGARRDLLKLFVPPAITPILRVQNSVGVADERFRLLTSQPTEQEQEY